MPSVNSIRKEILQALEQHVLYALWQPDIPMRYSDPSLDFLGNIKARLLKRSVPRKDTSNIELSLQSRWPSANLHSTHETLLAAEQAAKYYLSRGLYAMQLHA